MEAHPNLRLRIIRTLGITLAWMAVGAVSAVFEHRALADARVEEAIWPRLLDHLLEAACAGVLGGGVYIFVLRDRLRHLSYFPALAVMALLVAVVLGAWKAAWPAWQDPLGASFTDRVLSLDWLGHYLYWTALMGGTMLMVRLSDQYGFGGIAHLDGRYHRPKQELRIFMFLDMRSSTMIAEELGHARYFQLINELFQDITDPIVHSRGEIYQYVGDEISVSWTLRKGIKKQRCIRCFLDIRAKLRKRGPYYRDRYGIRPTFKAGFHYGEVTTGEVGLVKKERIFSGDVVNTAARIQETCNAQQVDNLVSKELLDLLRQEGPLPAREVGSIALKGKRSTMSLWTIEPGDGKTADQ